jgi:acyl-homoserine lactone acylase PvdQ
VTYDPPVPWSPTGPDEKPSTLPKDGRGQAINEQRRELNAAIEAFEAKYGRKPTKRELEQLRRGL